MRKSQEKEKRAVLPDGSNFIYGPSWDEGPSTSKQNASESVKQGSSSLHPASGSARANFGKFWYPSDTDDDDDGGYGNNELQMGKQSTMRYIDARGSLFGGNKTVGETFKRPKTGMSTAALNVHADPSFSTAGVAGGVLNQFPERKAKMDFASFDPSDVSSIASSSEVNSTGCSSDMETAAPTNYGSGDAGYPNDNRYDCSQLPVPQPASSALRALQAQSSRSHASQSHLQPQAQPQPQPRDSNLSQEWLEESVRGLAADLGISVPRYNFNNPNINFARNERQFDDPNYLRMEDRAMFGLRLAQNKSFFGNGKYM